MKYRQLIVAATFALAACCGLSFIPANLWASQSRFSRPDFAFPRSAMQDASLRLDKALKNHDEPAALRALIDMGLAETAFAPDSIQSSIRRIEKIRDEFNSGQFTALSDILMAEIYAQLYQSQRWKFDERHTESDTIPDDLFLWSGQQFINQIHALIKNAVEKADSLPTRKISDLIGLVECPEQVVETYNLSVGDFIAFRGCNILQQISLGNDASIQLYRRLLSNLKNRSNSPATAVYIRMLQLPESDNMERFSLLHEIFDTYLHSTPASIEVLDAMLGCVSPEDSVQISDLFTLSKQYLELYPSYFRKSVADNIIARLTAPSIQLEAQGDIVPGANLIVNLVSNNIGSATITLLKADSKISASSLFASRGDLHPIQSIKVDFTTRKPPFRTEKSVSIPIDAPGRYALCVNFDGENKSQSAEQLRLITCTRIALIETSLPKHNYVYALDAMSGTPLESVHIRKIKQDYPPENSIFIGKTDSEGKLALPASFDGEIIASIGSDFSRPLNVWSQISESDEATLHINAFTSLSLYHPGDTIKWGAVAYIAKGHDKRPADGRAIKITMRDANHQIVDTLITHTDTWGRIRGQFIVPANTLAGTYRLTFDALPDKHSGRRYHSPTEIHVTVSDYKLPTFAIEQLKALPDTKNGYRIEGLARTFTDIPLVGAKIKIELKSSRPRLWWNAAPARTFYSESGQTTNKGLFSFTIPDSILCTAPFPKGIFQCIVTVTDASGESQFATTTFTPTPVRLLDVSLPSIIDISKPVHIQARLVRPDGEPIGGDIYYTISQNGIPVVLNRLYQPSTHADWSHLEPGTYEITFSTTESGTDSPNESVVQSVILYKPSEAPSPVSAPIWLPATSIISDTEGNASIIYGTPAGESHVLLIMYNPDNGSVIATRWLKTEGGMSVVNMKLPEGLTYVTASLISLRDFRYQNYAVSISRPSEHGKLRIERLSMRDRTAPLEHESWKFRLHYEDGTPAEGAVFADMYSLALNSLTQHPFTFSPSNGWLWHLRVSGIYPGTVRRGFYGSPAHIAVPALQLPEWQFWNMTFAPRQFARTLLTRQSYASGVDGVIEEGVTADTMMHKANLLFADDTSEDVMDEGSSGTESTLTDIRPSEVPLAFFLSDLTTDSEGYFNVDFTMPNSVTSWMLKAFAYDKQMQEASFSAEVLSVKPLMIKPTFPRFLRAGDHIDFTMTVFNTTDTTQESQVRLIIREYDSGKLIASKMANISIDANSESSVRLSFDALTPEGTLLLISAVVSTDNFSDGEQSLVPVLESDMSVTESVPFYIGPAEREISLNLKSAISSDATRTLQFCENPAWSVLTALPAVSSDGATTTSIQTACQLFMLSVLKGIIYEFPDLKNEIRRLAAIRDSASVLPPGVGLQMDASTPWVAAAQSDADRIRLLAALIEGNTCDLAISKSLTLLSNLQDSSGGWKWLPTSREASLWATESVLRVLGELNELGWLPNDKSYREILRKGLGYLDNVMAERYSKHPDPSFIDYAILRNSLDTKVPKSVQPIIRAAVKEALASWKAATPVQKARMALLLNENGHSKDAEEILRSLDEYAIKTPHRGTHWERTDDVQTSSILHAYAALSPHAQLIDSVRQWLISQKESVTWGNGLDAATIIANFATSSARWIAPPKGSSIIIGADSIYTSPEGHSGFFILPLSQEESTITIARSADTPAWGAVISRYTLPKGILTNTSTADLSIEKTLLKQNLKSNGVDWVPTTSLQLGDKVLVRLTIETKRDMDFVSIVDNRATPLEPVEQLPVELFTQGTYIYRECADSSTRFFIEHLPKGIYVITYETTADCIGTFAGGSVTISSALNPALTASLTSGTIAVTEPTPMD